MAYGIGIEQPSDQQPIPLKIIATPPSSNSALHARLHQLNASNHEDMTDSHRIEDAEGDPNITDTRLANCSESRPHDVSRHAILMVAPLPMNAPLE